MCQIIAGQGFFIRPSGASGLAAGMRKVKNAHGLVGGMRTIKNISDKQADIMRFWERYRVMLNRLGGAVHIPHHAGSLAAIGLVGGMAGLGMIMGGHSLQALKLAGSFAGLGVNKVQISGNKRVSEIDILQALGLDGDTSLPVLNIDEARAALGSLPWVEHVSVRKIYPDKLAVSLVEKRAFAVWQKNGAVDIIDSKGRIIVPYNSADAQGLPFFVGEGAAEQAQAFLDGMKQFPDLEARARAYIRIAGRRWDILLDNGLRIKLPEKGAFARLKEAELLDRREGLFTRDIESLDLRLDDRITVALGAEAYARRAQAVKDVEKREKALKAGAVTMPKNGRQA